MQTPAGRPAGVFYLANSRLIDSDPHALSRLHRCLHQPTRRSHAAAGLRLGPAAGAHHRHLAGLGHGRRTRHQDHQLPYAGGVGLYAQVPVGAADGPVRATFARPPARLDGADATAVGRRDRRDGQPVAEGRHPGPGLDGGAGGVFLRLSGHRLRRLSLRCAAQRGTRRRGGCFGAGVPPGDAGIRRPGPGAGRQLHRLARHLLADGRTDAGRHLCHARRT